MPIDEKTSEWMTERYWADDAALRDARDAFAAADRPLIEVPNESGAALATLVRATGARRIIEVGTLFGYSAVWMARALPEGGHIDTLELMDEHADAAQGLFEAAGVADRITIHRGPALASLTALTGPWDLAFIDADKAGYVGYAEHLLDLGKIRSGGSIIADNLAAGGRLADAAVDNDHVNALRAYHDFMARETRLESNVLPIGDGLGVSIVR